MIRHCNNPSSSSRHIDSSTQHEKAVLSQKKDGEWRELADLQGKRTIRIGRSSSNDIVTSDQTCSKQHCEIRRVEGRWILRDLKSYNGTFWQGKRVTDPITLQSKNRIRVGKQEFLFVIEQLSKSDGEVFSCSTGENRFGRDTLELPSETVVKTLFDRAMAIALKPEKSAATGGSHYDQAIAHLFNSARLAGNPRFRGLNSLWRAVFVDAAIDLLQAAEQESLTGNYPVVVNSDFHELSAIVNLSDYQIELALWESLRNKIQSCQSKSAQEIAIRKMCGQSLPMISEKLKLPIESVELTLIEIANTWKTDRHQ